MIKAWIKYSIVAFSAGLLCLILGMFLVFPLLLTIIFWLSIPFFPILRVAWPDFFKKRGF